MKSTRQVKDWRTKNINPKVKKLILGSFTSKDGLNHFYYCSEFNDFYYLLDYSLSEIKIDDKKEPKPKAQKEMIKEQGKFAKLREELYKADDASNKQQKRKELHDLLNEYGFDICDIFKKVKMKRENSSLDSDIDLKSKDTVIAKDCLKALKGSNVKTIYCTSKFVKNQFEKINKKIDLGFEGKVISLPSPSRRYSKEDFLSKCKAWKEILKNN